MRSVVGVGAVAIPFLFIMSVEAQVVDMLLAVQSAPSITTSGGEIIFPENSESHQFEGGSGGTFDFVNPDGSSVTIIFFIGTTQVTLDFFIDSYDQAVITADRPLPAGRNVVGSLIYDMRTFEGSTETLTFDAPFAMTVHYPEAQLGNLDEETLGIYFWDESQNIWTAFDVDSRDTEQNTITILSDHLTLFATLGEVKEAAPSGGGGSGDGGGYSAPPSPGEKIILPEGEVQKEEIVEELIEPEGSSEPERPVVEEFTEELPPGDSEQEPDSTLFDILVEPAAREDLQRRNMVPIILVLAGVIAIPIVFLVLKRRKKIKQK